jgi:8-oxo-dGTP pyrophosphatase MutT (NUDIX family)
LIDARELYDFVAAFPEDLKSRELVLQLLEHTPAPFSRAQFQPGHVTSTGLVLHPEQDAFVLVHHRRLDRWLLPGGHVEPEDAAIWDTARREVLEETGAELVSNGPPSLVGIDVHGIPPGRGEPFHLHHDLIFALRAVSARFAPTEEVRREVRRVVWCSVDEWDRYNLPLSIRSSARRALEAPR